MRHAKRVDANHSAIRDVLRKAGWQVEDLSHVGHGVPDLVAQKDGRLPIWIEVKDGDKPPSARALTADECWFHAILQRAGIQVQVITSVEDALALR